MSNKLPIAILSLFLAFSTGLHAQELVQNGDFTDGTNHWRGDCKPAGAENTTDFVNNSKVHPGVIIELLHSKSTSISQQVAGISSASVTVTIEYSVSPDFKGISKTSSSVPGANNAIQLSFEAPVPGGGNRLSNGTTTNPSDIAALGFIPGPPGESHTFTHVLQHRGFFARSEPQTFEVICPAGDGKITITKISLTPAANNFNGFPGSPPSNYSGASGGYPGSYSHPQQPPAPSTNQ